MARRRADAALRRLGALCVLGAALGAGAACAASAPDDTSAVELPPLGELALQTELSLAAAGGGEAGGLGREVAAELRLTPASPGDWELISAPGAEHQGALLEVSLAWKDFVGTSPSSFGRTNKSFVAFGEDAILSQAMPLSRVFRFDVPLPETRILARRVELTVRLHPIDIRGEALRTGGARVEFPPASLETFRREPAAPLEQLLTDPSSDPEELFLAAVQVPGSRREQRLGELVASLSELRGERREALFGALQFLTGTTQGRSVARWQEWWALRAEG